jgi:hypothetical protein
LVCWGRGALQRKALDSRRPQVVLKVDRSGLNDTHPVVRALYAAIDKVLAPIVADEERRANARVIRPTKGYSQDTAETANSPGCAEPSGL